MSSHRSWFITSLPLIIYIFIFVFTIITGTNISEQQAEMLSGLLYAFLGAGALGVSKSVIPKFTKQQQ